MTVGRLSPPTRPLPAVAARPTPPPATQLPKTKAPLLETSPQPVAVVAGPSAAEIVQKWATEIIGAAPPRHQRDFAEYMVEQLPLLISRLQGANAPKST